MDAFILPQRSSSSSTNSNRDREELVSPSPSEPGPGTFATLPSVQNCLKFSRKFRVHPDVPSSGASSLCVTPEVRSPSSSAFRRQSSQNASRRSCISLLDTSGNSSFGGLNFNSLKRNRNKVSCALKEGRGGESVEGTHRPLSGSPSVGDLPGNVRLPSVIGGARSSPQLTTCDQTSTTRNRNFFYINNNCDDARNNNEETSGVEPISTGHGNLGVTISSSGRSDGGSGFKKFLIASTTLLYIFLLATATISVPETLAEETTSTRLGNRDAIQNIWKQLSKDEIRSIFGPSHAHPGSDEVPNFDIVEPTIIHRKARGKRSLDDSSPNHPTHNIKLTGLGNKFVLDIHPNRNLLDAHFVFLTRNQNRSEIMPESHVSNNLACFYHGTAEVADDKNSTQLNATLSRGSVALSLCGGMKGIILPWNGKDRSRHYHYVIHPVPDRLRSNQNDKAEHEQEHFLFKRQNELSHFSAHQRRPEKHAKSLHDDDHHLDNNDHGTCAHNNHHHTAEQTPPLKDINSHATPSVTMNGSPTRSPNSRSNYIPPNSNKQDKSVNTLNRKRRSADIFTNNGPYASAAAYNRSPSSVSPTSASDSYWLQSLQYRSNLFNGQKVSSTAAFPSSYWRHKSAERITTNPFGDMNRRRYSVDDTSASNDEYDSSSAGRNHGGMVGSSRHGPWSKGVVLYESTASVEEDEPDTILPFYTKGRKRTSKMSKVASSSGSSSPWVPSSLEGSLYGSSSRLAPSHVDKYSIVPDNFTVPLSNGESSGSRFRKGRRDENVFGRDWKSPLDSDVMYSEKKERIIHKQSRFDDDVSSNSIYSPPSSSSKDTTSKPPIPNQLTIETAVFIDKDLFAHMKSNFPDDTHGEVVRIVLAMINAVQLLYHDPSLGHRVDFVLKRLEVLETDPPGLIRPFDIDRFLTNFCRWQKTENPPSDADPLHWDHALILTGLDLYVVHQSGKISNQVVGLAPVAGMCTRSSSCTVNEGRHFESVFVISHEIGHNLGMRHDGPQADNDCDPTSHIMSPTLGSGKITWSPCSRKYLDMFLETSQSKCLLDKAKSEIRLDHDADGRLPGERFDADRQCVLKYGRGSFHATQQPLEDVCRDLHCRREHYTWTSHPALEGTFCGNDMWCRAGKCVRRTDPFSSQPNEDNTSDYIGSNHLPGGETAAYSSLKAVDGAWGKWSLFTDCSSACLSADNGGLKDGSTGIRLAARRCDSPRPENGGRQCSGQDRRYKTCEAHSICSGNVGRTTVSQYANEVCNRAASVDTELTGVGYMMNTNDAERACSVWCETMANGVPRSRGWSFPDGTSCKLVTRSDKQSFCVAGKCQEFACNPYSHYALSDGECSSSSSNEVTPTSSWYVGSSSSSRSRGSQRNGKTGWTDWEIHSECKLPCLAPAKGLELVKRLCSAGDSLCSGLALSVRLCNPDKSTIIRNGCTRLQTPFEYATKVCSKYSEKITGLSGIGMQLSPTKDDKDRPCRIGCQDATIPYRFYMVNGEDGWFPAGTDCSRGEPNKKAYCLAGKCVDFGNDDTPTYRINSKVMGRIENLFQRNKRQATYNIMEPLKVAPSLDQSSLRDLVHKFSQQTGNFPSIATSRTSTPVDFNRPVHLQGSASEYPLVSSRGLSPSSSSYKTYSNSDQNDNYYSNNRNYNRPSGTYHGDSNRGRSLSLEYVDLDGSKDLFPPTGSNGRMIAATQPSNNHNSLHWSGMAFEGSYYEWRKIVSDCSVSCGSGIQEIIVECVSGDTVVSDRLCEGRPRPGHSGYADCYKPSCLANEMSDRSGQSSHIWNWLQSILPKNSTHPPVDRSFY